MKLFTEFGPERRLFGGGAPPLLFFGVITQYSDYSMPKTVHLLHRNSAKVTRLPPKLRLTGPDSGSRRLYRPGGIDPFKLASELPEIKRRDRRTRK